MSDKIKRNFFKAAVVSILFYGCTSWTLMKCIEKWLDENSTRMLRAIMNKSWKQHPMKQQVYGHLPPISKTFQIRRIRHAGHRMRVRRKRPALFKSGLWHFHQDNAPVHNSILVTDLLTKMSIKTVPQPPYSPDLGPCDFWLFPKLRGCRYETIEEMKEAVTKVIDTHTQEAFQKLLERYNKSIAAGGDYFEVD